MLVQRRRDSWAALRLMRKLLKKQGFVPKLRKRSVSGPA
jgi:transposase-like protein